MAHRSLSGHFFVMLERKNFPNIHKAAFFLSFAATLRVYVNNADDKNEECMEIEVLYTSTGAGDGEGGAPPV